MIDEDPAGRVTLERHTLEFQQRHTGATRELTVLLTQVAYAGKIFAHALSRAPSAGVSVPLTAARGSTVSRWTKTSVSSC